MKPEKQHLLHSVLDEHADPRREATLLAGGRILRRKRWRRVALRNLTVLAILGMALFSIQRMTAPRPRDLAPAAAPKDQARSLTDNELLALFPNTPVALATLENGKKRLIFPRAGDEKRFIISND